mgnify:CR=1 FL=1
MANTNGNKTETSTKKHYLLIITINLVAMILLAILLLVGVLKWMKSYTRFGQYIEVPEIEGLLEAEAASLLAANGLSYEISDYKFDRTVTAGCIIEQRPAAHSQVKEGRIIYLTINTGKEPTRSIPDVADNSSLRAAESKLRAAGFKLTEPEYIEGDMDWVYDVLYEGKPIMPGMEIPEGSTLTIVAGNGNPVENIEEQDSTTNIDTDFFGL